MGPDALVWAIGRAEASVKQTATTRAVLLKSLAKVQSAPLAEVTRRQDEIDHELDALPGTPTAAPADPAPSPPKDNEPPSTKPPKTPKPKPPVANPPPASASRVDKAVAFAKAQLGEPYKWGASGPNSWDCSGLTMKSWAAAGVGIPHYGGAQYTTTKHVPMSRIQRGDLLYWSNGGAGSIYHVAMSLGGGQMIQAPRTGRNVEIVSLTYWIKPDLASRPG